VKVYHTYTKSKGFDLNKMELKRGIFTLPEDRFNIRGKQYNPFSPNEFGDAVVELEIEPSTSKVFTAGEQYDAIKSLMKDGPIKSTLLNWLEMGGYNDPNTMWTLVDRSIGTLLTKKGYDLIHYTTDPLYGDVWVILNKKAIKAIKYEKG
jgi:hypothetical protein